MRIVTDVIYSPNGDAQGVRRKHMPWFVVAPFVIVLWCLVALVFFATIRGIIWILEL